MKLTQGVLKYCNIHSIVFDDKYSNVKSIVTKDSYNSKFSNSLSQTSTILSDDNSFYNRVENCNLFDCDVKNGKFLNCNFLGSGNVTGMTSGFTNYIDDGYFSGCTFSGYTINGGKFYNCIVHENNLWENGYWDNENGTDDFKAAWHNGVWNRGHFASAYGWTGGTFNGGVFESPAEWYNGIANGGTFSGITWHTGLVRNANFYYSRFVGVFNKGTFTNSIFEGGTFNNGYMYNSTIVSGTIYDGYFSGCTITDATPTFDMPVVKGGSFFSTRLNGGIIENMKLGSNLTVQLAKLYNGTYNSGKFYDCDIYNGTYVAISGSSLNTTIHNGTFIRSKLDDLKVHNGNFTNCTGNRLNWEYGVFNDGTLIDCTWRDGYINDSLFSGSTALAKWYDGHFYGQTFWGTWYGGYFHYGYKNGVLYTQKPKPKWVTTPNNSAGSSTPSF